MSKTDFSRFNSRNIGVFVRKRDNSWKPSKNNFLLLHKFLVSFLARTFYK